MPLFDRLPCRDRKRSKHSRMLPAPLSSSAAWEMDVVHFGACNIFRGNRSLGGLCAVLKLSILSMVTSSPRHEPHGGRSRRIHIGRLSSQAPEQNRVWQRHGVTPTSLACSVNQGKLDQRQPGGSETISWEISEAMDVPGMQCCSPQVEVEVEVLAFLEADKLTHSEIGKQLNVIHYDNSLQFTLIKGIFRYLAYL